MYNESAKKKNEQLYELYEPKKKGENIFTCLLMLNFLKHIPHCFGTLFNRYSLNKFDSNFFSFPNFNIGLAKT